MNASLMSYSRPHKWKVSESSEFTTCDVFVDVVRNGKLQPNRQQQLSVCQCADLTMTSPKLHGIIIKWVCL